MIQVIKTKCCNKVFAACKEPECYTDAEWHKDLRKYVKEGCTVEMVEKGKLDFQDCTCKKDKEITLFDQLLKS